MIVILEEPIANSDSGKQVVGPGKLGGFPVKGTKKLIEKIKKGGDRESLQCKVNAVFPCLPLTHKFLNLCFPILEESRFVIGNIQNWCGGVEQGPENPAGVMRPCYLVYLVLCATESNSV